MECKGYFKIRPGIGLTEDGLDLDLTDRLEAAEHLYSSLCPYLTLASIASFPLFSFRLLSFAYSQAFLRLLPVFACIHSQDFATEHELYLSNPESAFMGYQLT